LFVSRASFIRGLLSNRSGVAMIEFALGAPFLLMAGLWGVEVANYALVNMKISQLAEHIADNASRVGDTSTLQNRRIYESDINDLLLGADLQAGRGIDLYEHGRVIVSSVEVWDQSVHGTGGQNPGTQFIHWQRCLGALNSGSDYGNQNQALPNGIGPTGEEVSAEPDAAVIFVEINYEYQPLISARFMGDLSIEAIASFMVRDSRDLSGLLQRNPTDPDYIANCATYTNAAALTS
jgi:hypothetical protein